MNGEIHNNKLNYNELRVIMTNTEKYSFLKNSIK